MSLLTAGGVSAAAGEVAVVKADKRVLPPDRREFQSPSGRFVLTVSTSDHWATRTALAELVDVSGAARQPVWSQALPQQQGPRHVLVANSGAVVLIDEWINIPSPHALMLLSPEGKTLAHYGLDALIATLGVPRRTITAHNQLGVWLSRMPVFSPDESALVLAAGGRGLSLDMASGHLKLVPTSP
ncbi:hypothetical protein [Sphaerotilus montanus]|uniref:hypothetical protein n=1 Tax=Sphaerotilus montanus TaxID=522889 RepID=UPI003FA2AF2C